MTENEFYEKQAFSWIRNMKEAAIEECGKNGNSPKCESRITKTQTIIRVFEEIQQYRAIGTVEECRKAVEKQKAKKPIRIDMCTCPNCGTYNETVKKRRKTVNEDIVYCWHCGQAMLIRQVD